MTFNPNAEFRAKRPKLSHNEGNDYLPEALRGSGDPLRETTRWRRERDSLFMPTRNGYRDPLSVMLVTDLLLRLEHDHILRARHLTDMLKSEYKQVAWDAVTVGRILGSIEEAGRDIGAFKTGRTNSGLVMALNVTPRVWNWLMQARNNLAALAKADIEARRAGIRDDGEREFPWGAFQYTKKENVA